MPLPIKTYEKYINYWNIGQRPNPPYSPVPQRVPSQYIMLGQIYLLSVYSPPPLCIKRRTYPVHGTGIQIVTKHQRNRSKLHTKSTVIYNVVCAVVRQQKPEIILEGALYTARLWQRTGIFVFQLYFLLVCYKD